MANIQDVRSANNPQRQFEWEVSILAVAAAGSLPVLTERAMNVSIPEKSVEPIEINFKSRKTFHAGRDAAAHSISVTLWETEDREIFRFFNNWMENGISNSVAGGGTTRDIYSTQLLIKTFAADSEEVTGTHRFTNVFPTSIGDVQLSYDSSEALQIEVTFSYDSHLFEG